MTLLFNTNRTTLLPEYQSTVPTDNRGLINETAVRIAASSFENSTEVNSLEESTLATAEANAREFIDRFRTVSVIASTSLSLQELAESKILAARLLEMLARKVPNLRFYVPVSGAGVIDRCVIDATTNDEIIEIKAGNRLARSDDIRQALVYAALLHMSNPGTPVKSICIVNPRLGWSTESNVDDLLHSAGGYGWSEFLGTFADFISGLSVFELERD